MVIHCKPPCSITHGTRRTKSSARSSRELSADELTKLAAAVEVAERIVPTHPHAGVESGAANLAVGPFVSLLDRDALGRLSVKRWQRCRHAELRDEVCLKPDRISGDHLTKELPGR